MPLREAAEAAKYGFEVLKAAMRFGISPLELLKARAARGLPLALALLLRRP
jgi:hypothetical protein